MTYQQYAFFKYSDELAARCQEELEDQYRDLPGAHNPNMIRIHLVTMQWVSARATAAGLQRPVLEDWVFDSLMICPTTQARLELITELYDEAAQRRAREVQSTSVRPFA